MSAGPFIAGLFCIVLAQSDEPRVRGRPASEWLAAFRAADDDARQELLGGAFTPADMPPLSLLVHWLDDPDPATRLAGLIWVKFVPDPEQKAVPVVRRRFDDPDPMVRANAAAAVQYLTGEAEPALTILRKLEKEGELPVRRFALNMLARNGVVDSDPALTDLMIEESRSPDAVMRRHALWGLRSLNEDGRFTEQIKPFIADPDEDVRVNAALIVMECGGDGDEPTRVLIAAAKSGDRRVRQRVVTGLAKAPEGRVGEAIAALIGLLADADAEIRSGGLSSLANLAGEGFDVSSAIPAIVARLDDGDVSVREVVPSSLAAIGADPVALLPDLARHLEDASEMVRANVLYAMEQAGPEVVRVLPQLITALNHPSPATRQATAKVIALGGANAAAAVAPLILRLDDPVLDVRLWSAFALREIGGASVAALPRLMNALAEDPEPKMRVEAARTIAAIGPLAGGAADVLVLACRDPQADVRLWSLFALGELNVNTDAVLATLKQAATANDATVAAEANKALAKFGEAHDEAAIANAPAAPPVMTPIAAPIVYDGLALVLVDAHGAAVVLFGDESHETTKGSTRDGVKFRFRYLAKGQNDATGGVGEAFAVSHEVAPNFLVEDVAASHSFVDAGPLRAAWSYRKQGSAYVYWRPEELTVTFASALEFETLDLHRFLR